MFKKCLFYFSQYSHLFVKIYIISLMFSQQLEAQCKSKPQKQVCKTVLKHFEVQYSEELGEQWHSAR